MRMDNLTRAAVALVRSELYEDAMARAESNKRGR